MDWTWSDGWESSELEQAVWPETEELNDPVVACIAAHGYVYVWTGNNLIRLASELGYSGGGVHRRQRFAFAHDEENEGASLYLGRAGVPAEQVNAADRMTVVGNAMILAIRNGFLWTNLGDLRAEASEILTGEPIAQVGDAVHWVCWILQEEGAQLYCASAANSHFLVEPYRIKMDEDACPSPQSIMVISEGFAYWQATDKTMWKLDCVAAVANRGNQKAVRVDAGNDAIYLWGKDGEAQFLHRVAERMVWTSSKTERIKRSVTISGGSGALDTVCTLGVWIVKIQGNLLYVHRADGSMPPAPPAQLNGHFVAAVLAENRMAGAGANREPRLLLLYRTDEGARLDVYQPHSGITDILWRDQTVNPQSLLPVGDSLYIVHEYGLVRFQAKIGEKTV